MQKHIQLKTVFATPYDQDLNGDGKIDVELGIKLLQLQKQKKMQKYCCWNEK